MAQLRRDYSKIEARQTAVVVVGPDSPNAFAEYWKEHDLPFTGLPDPEHHVLKLYGQEIKMFKFGRMPAQALIDKAGIVRFVHYGHDMRDIPSTEEVLALVDALNQEEGVTAASSGPAGAPREP
jgi:peroxiredoxin